MVLAGCFRVRCKRTVQSQFGKRDLLTVIEPNHKNYSTRMAADIDSLDASDCACKS